MRIAHAGTSISLNQVVLDKMMLERERGHEVTALCPDDEWARGLRSRGLPVIDIPFARRDILAAPAAIRRTWAVCRRQHFDIVHTHNALPAMTGRFAARFAGIAGVVHTFRAWPLNEPRHPLIRLGFRALEPLASRATDAILFQNPDDLESWSRLPGVPLDRATLVGNGIDVERVRSQVGPDGPKRIRREFGATDETFLLVKVARLERLKGHAFFLEGVKRLVEQSRRKVVALCVGIGEDEPLIRSEVERLALSDVVHFTGYRDDVPDILAAADVSVLTSMYEGVPRALMESMALSKPVVATNVPGTRMLVQDGRTGALVQPGDVEALTEALLQLMEDPDLAATRGRLGSRRVERAFDERQIVNRILQVYEWVLAGDGSPIPRWDLLEGGLAREVEPGFDGAPETP
jgi:glycosyltransferase involved in cell wall biosynthesis